MNPAMVFVGMFVMLGGPAASWFIYKVNQNKLAMASAPFFLLGGMLAGIGSTASRDAPNGSPTFVTGGLVLIAIGLVLVVASCLLKSKAMAEEYGRLALGIGIALIAAIFAWALNSTLGSRGSQDDGYYPSDVTSEEEREFYDEYGMSFEDYERTNKQYYDELQRLKNED